MNATDVRYMRLALSLGRRGQGRVWPNPAVGCVIVAGGRIVARAHTADGGRPHAETQALAQAGPAARGATAYVTLEPCAHHGQTPPCCDALIAAGVARVVVATGDPDPRVAGRGIAALRAAGIDVLEGVCAQDAASDLYGFFKRTRDGLPELTLKLATSIDGRIATATGESKWITGPMARRATHAMRAAHDAVMVGAGTARADDPSLTVRGLGITRQPVRVVVSRKLDLPLGSALAQTAREVPLWLAHGPDAAPEIRAAWEGLGARLIEVALRGRQIDCTALMQALGTAGLTRVFCEGGGAFAASLMAADLVDTLAGFSAGMVLGAEGQPAIGALGLPDLASAPRFDLVRQRRVGCDVWVEWRRGDRTA